MKHLHFFSLGLLCTLLFALSSCGGSDTPNTDGTAGTDSPIDSAANSAFNEGMALSMEAVQAMEANDLERAQVLNAQAVELFTSVLDTDPNNLLATSAIGHSYYLMREFDLGIEWYQKAIAIDSSLAVNHLEYGLCLMNKGKVDLGRQAINTALQLDPSEETRDQAVYSLYNIAVMAWDFGSGYEQNGEPERGHGFKTFGIHVLLTANQYHPMQVDVVQKLQEYSQALGDTAIANYVAREVLQS